MRTPDSRMNWKNPIGFQIAAKPTIRRQVANVGDTGRRPSGRGGNRDSSSADLCADGDADALDEAASLGLSRRRCSRHETTARVRSGQPWNIVSPVRLNGEAGICCCGIDPAESGVRFPAWRFQHLCTQWRRMSAFFMSMHVDGCQQHSCDAAGSLVRSRDVRFHN